MCPDTPMAAGAHSSLGAAAENLHELLGALAAAVYTTDAEGRITYYNEAAADMWGHRPELNKSVWCGSWKLYWPDGRPMPHDQCPMATALKENRAINGAEGAAERPDGTRVPFLAFPMPLRDRSGALRGAVNTLIDLRRYREIEARFGAIVGQVTAGIAETDLTGRFVFVNQRYSKLVGYTEAELLQVRMQDITHPEDLPRNLELFEKLAQTGADFTIEKRYLRKDGTIVWVNNSVSGVRYSGVLANVVAVSIDITERKKIEQELREQSDRLDALNRIGKILSSDLDLERIVQAATDSATKLIGAKFGAFFYNVTDARGESFLLYTLSGAPRAAFERFGLPRNTAIFDPTFRGVGIVRSDDIRADPRYGRNAPHYGMPKGHLPVVSYLAVPVVSRSGEVLGGLFFGHDQPGMFAKNAEDIVAGIAAHAAIAIDNARLLKDAQSEVNERRRAEEQQDLLLREMSHRIKNLLAIASGVVTLSARSARSPEEMARSIRDRLGALAKAHELVRPSSADVERLEGRRTTLEDLLRAIFSPYVDPGLSGDHERVIFRGPDFPISGNAMTSLALVLHELATNTAKYGALSSLQGSVEIDWNLEGDMLVLKWDERNGPPIDGPPVHEGFGSLLARRSIGTQLGGRITHEWKPEGLTIHLFLPVAQLAK